MNPVAELTIATPTPHSTKRGAAIRTIASTTTPTHTDRGTCLALGRTSQIAPRTTLDRMNTPPRFSSPAGNNIKTTPETNRTRLKIPSAMRFIPTPYDAAVIAYDSNRSYCGRHARYRSSR